MKSGQGTLQQETCRNCGTRHFTASRQNRICRGTVKNLDWNRSATGIAELAAQARAEAEMNMRSAASSQSPIAAAFRTERAFTAYAKAYALEN